MESSWSSYGQEEKSVISVEPLPVLWENPTINQFWDAGLNKLQILELFLEQGDVLLTVSSHIDGVDIPASLKDREMIDFILGLTPTPKMSMNDDGVTAPMRFSGVIHHCFFPWESILQMSAQDAVIQFRNSGKSENGPAQNEQTETKLKKKEKTHLRLIK